MQTKKLSLIESACNVCTGYLVAVISQIVIFPKFGIHLTMDEQLHIAAWFLIISIIRMYAVRRAFNKLEK